jgi:hypothetical protein
VLRNHQYESHLLIFISIIFPFLICLPPSHTLIPLSFLFSSVSTFFSSDPSFSSSFSPSSLSNLSPLPPHTFCLHLLFLRLRLGVAAPFTSRTPSVRAVVDLIRQGNRNILCHAILCLSIPSLHNYLKSHILILHHIKQVDAHCYQH